MKQKFATIFLLILLTVCFATVSTAQYRSKKSNNQYAAKIDKLRKQTRLIEYFYPNKSSLGALSGYFLDGKLVYFKVSSGGDQLETQYFVYLNSGDVYKIIITDYQYDTKRRAIYTGKCKVIYFDLPSVGSSVLVDVMQAIEDMNREEIHV